MYVCMYLSSSPHVCFVSEEKKRGKEGEENNHYLEKGRVRVNCHVTRMRNYLDVLSKDIFIKKDVKRDRRLVKTDYEAKQDMA